MEESQARDFVESLKLEIPKLAALKSSLEIDEELQNFASRFSGEYLAAQKSNENSGKPIGFLNADAVYLTAIASLRLEFRLGSRSRSPDDHGSRSPDDREKIRSDERDFSNEILNSGCVVYASNIFVSNVFRFLIDGGISNAAEEAIRNGKANHLRAFIDDYDGGTGEILSDVLKLAKRTTVEIEK